MKGLRLLVLIGIAGVVLAYFTLDLGRYFTLEMFHAQRATLSAFLGAHPVLAPAIYFAVYVAMAAFSLPGATLLTLAGGAMFGVGYAVVLVSFASSLGALLAFLSARFIFRDAVAARFGERLRAVDAGVARDGAFYLFTLRLIPAFPFFLVNLAAGLTTLPARTFYWISQLGMLPATVLYVSAGTEIAGVDSLSGLISFKVLASLALLGILPLLAKKAIEVASSRRVYAGWPRPVHFDRNLIVIGAGSAGLVAAYIAAAVRARVTLVEKHRMGGDCLNTGCVPSKALLRSAKLLSQIRRARDYGIAHASAEFLLADVMDRVQRVIRTVAPHDSAERYRELGVECLQGEARMTSPYTVEVKGADGTQVLTTRAIVVATGARPFVPPIPGIDAMECLTSDTVWSLRELPRRLLVLGGGPIGCELAQCFARLGSQVIQVEMLPRILPREDPDISQMLTRRMVDDGVDVKTGHVAKRFLSREGQKLLIAQCEGREVEIAFDALLCAVGRVANTTGYGLEELGIGTSPARTIETNEYLQTRYPNILACGDVVGPFQFTHMAAHQAWYASVNALFGGFRRFRVDYSVVPWATFTDPEVARVGLNESEARAKGVAYEVTTYGIDELDRAITDEEAWGIVKVLTVPGKDRVLGATIVGDHAGDLIAEFVTAMKHGIGLNRMLGTIHAYPTLTEANKYAAGAWKRAHAPARLLALLGRFHAWRLGGAGRVTR
ncbi:MAG: FAD-dependent oxidoreductase [Casimicrobiaceae bacterium]